jgi:hypothetical protein
MVKEQKVTRMRKIFGTCIVLILTALVSNSVSWAGDTGKARFDEVKLKAILEQFVEAHASDPVIKRYRFDMTRDFLDYSLIERANGVWGIRQWTIEAGENGKHEIRQTVGYGPGLASIEITFTVSDSEYRIVDWNVIEIFDIIEREAS